jgi:hypothetical protein
MVFMVFVDVGVDQCGSWRTGAHPARGHARAGACLDVLPYLVLGLAGGSREGGDVVGHVLRFRRSSSRRS